MTLQERIAKTLLHQRYATTDERIEEWRAANNTTWKIALREAAAAEESVRRYGTSGETADQQRVSIVAGGADDELIEASVRAAINAGVAADGEHGVAAARVAARHMLAAIRNPCDKIFSHKWLDPRCVETGCQSLCDKSVTP